MTGRHESSGETVQPVGRDGDSLSDLPDLVARIVETMQRARLESIVITKGDFHLELKSLNGPVAGGTFTGTADRTAVDESPTDETGEGFHVITSPMIGTFYVAPAPGEPPFVRPGDTITQGQTIGIVEAMKTMNEIASDQAGIVVDIVADDAETVEYGSPLVRLQVQT